MEVDKKFEEAIRLLSNFEKDFPFKDPDPNLGGTVTVEANMNNKSNHSTILHALKENLHSKVKLPYVFLPRNAEEP